MDLDQNSCEAYAIGNRNLVTRRTNNEADRHLLQLGLQTIFSPAQFNQQQNSQNFYQFENFQFQTDISFIFHQKWHQLKYAIIFPQISSATNLTLPYLRYTV